VACHRPSAAGDRRVIPQMNIVAWGQFVPWTDPRQVEQDLIISRALVELFSDKFLRAELRFRGGTALNKLHFLEPLRKTLIWSGRPPAPSGRSSTGSGTSSNHGSAMPVSIRARLRPNCVSGSRRRTRQRTPGSVRGGGQQWPSLPRPSSLPADTILLESV